MSKKILCIILFLLCFTANPAMAASPGDLDTSFGTNGLVSTDFSNSDNGFAMDIQSDGKIIVAGNVYTGTDFNFALARYMTDGNPDTGFGTSGIVTTDFGSFDFGNSVAIQTDGKIIVAGRAKNGSYYDFALARYTTDGDLDTGFGTGGLVTTDFYNEDDFGNAVVIQTDGKIIVAGSAGNGTDYDFALARYTTDGDLDTDFGTGGLVTTDFGLGGLFPGYDSGNAVAIQADGKIIVAGNAGDGTYYDFALARYATGGALDTSFGTSGLVLTDFYNDFDYGYAVVIQADGKIIVAGHANNGTEIDIAMARYTTDGVLDTSFGTGGLVTTDFGGFDYSSAVAIQSDGKIIVAGYAGNGTDYDFALVRYTTDGDPDMGFGTGGLVATDFYNDDDFGKAVAIQADGKIVIAGNADNGAQSIFALAQYLDDTYYILTYTAGANGSIDGTTPQTVVPEENGSAVTAVPDMGYLFAGWSDGSTDNPRTDTNVTADISVAANFALDDSDDGGGWCFICTLEN